MNASISPAAEFHIVVPVFNEAEVLEDVLHRAEVMGYLAKVIFVNDASTDESGEILNRWHINKGIEVIHLAENRKKEGAIRVALETLEAQKRLPDKVILLDADSFMSPTGDGLSIDESLSAAVSHMDSNDIAAMGFRYDVFLPERPSLLQKAQYAEFARLRFINRVAPEQYQMWVINGRGGIFRSSLLLTILREIEPDFETGDILITQKVMQRGYRIGYYDQIKVETMDVDSLRDFSRQRRRWARGTSKVMIRERSFYAKEIAKHSKVGLIGLMYIASDVGVPLTILASILMTGEPMDILFNKLPLAMAPWIIISTALGVSDEGIRREGFTGKVIRWSLINAILHFYITMPSRLAGLMDTITYFVSGKADTPTNHISDQADQALQETTYRPQTASDHSTARPIPLK